MNRLFGLLLIVAALGSFSCAPLNYDPDDDGSHPGMIKVKSSGRSFHQGWNDTLASPDEKPGMTSSFTYDYWIDTTEVTQSHFSRLMSRHPVPDSSAYGKGDNHPVYYVTWFDAVLFCNERSKAEFLDTVYAYSALRHSPDGRVYELTGIRGDMSIDGYRLPTEAEWEYAARCGRSEQPFSVSSDSLLAQESAWYSKNSSNSTHPVARLRPNEWGFYDMAGNVFEWTNDWKGGYYDTAITNSMGAPHADNEYEKVIKGGSFNYSLSYLRPSNRTATYATSFSSAAEYVGFRCARGSIPLGQYIGTETDFVPNPVIITASRDEVRGFIGTSEIKVAFVNVSGANRTLCCVDFNRAFPSIREYLDDKKVYMPSISPDGRYVAYCSANEGQLGPSSITIRSLDSLNSPLIGIDADTAYIPRWWIDRTTQDTCLIYTNSAVTNSSPLWRSTKTFVRKVCDGRPVGEPRMLTDNGGFHDGRSADGRYLLTAYDRLMVRDLTTAEERQLFVFPDNGKDENGSVQVCNASLSPDTGDGLRCLFLDFGSPSASRITGSSYRIHEYLFVGSRTGAIERALRCPEKEYSWDGTEWSNHSRFAIGCGRNVQSQSHAVYAIDLEGRASKSLVAGTELQHPSLWIGFLVSNPSNFALDSIGRYDEPLLISDQLFFASKLLMFWNYHDSLEVVFIGSSVAIAGFDPSRITGFASFNMGYCGSGLTGQKNIVSNYILNHCSSVKIICSSLDVGWFGLSGGDATWGRAMRGSKGYAYDSAHSFWTAGITEDFKNIIRQIPLPVPGLDTAQGQFRREPYGWGASPPPFYGSLAWSFEDTNCQNNLATIQTIADTLRTRGIHWLMVNFPVHPYFKNDTAYSPWGPNWETALKVIGAVRAIDSTNAFFHFYDANMNGNHDYGNEDACDENHLSYIGAAKLSTRLDSIIHTIIP
ncbi:MAG: TIGR02171 family protein [Chitinispirillaceae bacterium]|nr:TIGR02171 family protein [Chitinispirillaceae bacterium]